MSAKAEKEAAETPQEESGKAWPDGGTVDSEGYIWSALVTAGKVARLDLHREDWERGDFRVDALGDWSVALGNFRTGLDDAQLGLTEAELAEFD